MKKLLVLLLTLAMVMSLFAGCASDDDSSSDTGSKDTGSASSDDKDTDTGSTEKAPEKIVIALNKMPEAYNLKTALEMIQEDERFSHVEFEILSSQEDFNAQLPIVVASGEQRDLVALGNPIIQQTWADAGSIIPIDEYINNLGIDWDKEYGQYAANSQNNGETFAIPHHLTKWALYYNKAVFDAAGEPYPDPLVPMTWEEYTALAARLTSGSGSEKVYGTFHLTWPMFWYGEAIQKLGGGEAFYNAEGLSNIEEPIFAEALERVYKMQHEDKSTQTQADLVTAKTSPTAFMNGSYGMTIAGGWILSWATDDENHPRDWEMGLAPMPVDEGTTQKTWGIVNSFGVTPTSANPELAVEIGVELTRLCAQLARAQEEANRTYSSDDLYVEIGNQLADEGIDTEVIRGIMANADTIFVTEKVTGPNNVGYEDIIKEEVEKYFVQAQDLATTIANIKERGDKAITE